MITFKELEAVIRYKRVPGIYCSFSIDHAPNFDGIQIHSKISKNGVVIYYANGRVIRRRYVNPFLLYSAKYVEEKDLIKYWLHY